MRHLLGLGRVKDHELKALSQTVRHGIQTLHLTEEANPFQVSANNQTQGSGGHSGERRNFKKLIV